jgi:hypothetical protein
MSECALPPTLGPREGLTFRETYVAFEKFAPDVDIGLDLSAEDEKALDLYQSGATTR